MNPKCLPLLCDPDDHEPLQLADDMLVNPKTGRRYSIRDGIPVFVDTATGKNRKYQSFYDRWAPLYDVSERVYKWFFRQWDFRHEVIRELEIAPAGRVLEVSVGTGANLRCLRTGAELFGLDISPGMLRKCVGNLERWRLSAELFQGKAERLPFRDAAFETVFTVGAINFFDDVAGAIQEMIRVAKPGRKIVIVGGTEKAVSAWYFKVPLARRYFLDEDMSLGCPIYLVPSTMGEIHTRELVGGKLYCLTFRKP